MLCLVYLYLYRKFQGKRLCLLLCLHQNFDTCLTHDSPMLSLFAVLYAAAIIIDIFYSINSIIIFSYHKYCCQNFLERSWYYFKAILPSLAVSASPLDCILRSPEYLCFPNLRTWSHFSFSTVNMTFSPRRRGISSTTSTGVCAHFFHWAVQEHSCTHAHADLHMESSLISHEMSTGTAVPW